MPRIERRLGPHPSPRIGAHGSSPSRIPVSIVIAVILLVILFMGGNLVPVSTRDYFTTPAELQIDSPTFIDHNAYGAALWARDHLVHANRSVWGDHLVYSVFGGFGQFTMRFEEYPVFQYPSLNDSVWSRVHVGDYVITDVYMTRVTPVFLGLTGPTDPLNVTQVNKFQDPRYFAAIYQDSTFTIYQVIAKPLGA